MAGSSKQLTGIKQLTLTGYTNATKDSGTIYFVRDTSEGSTNGDGSIYIGTKQYASFSSVSAAAVKKLTDSVASACGFVTVTDGSYISSMPKTGTTYLTSSSTVTLTEALVVLDKAIKANADAITANKITAADNSVTVTSAATGTTVGVKLKTDGGLVLDESGLSVNSAALVQYTGANAIAVSDAVSGKKTISLTIDPSDKILSQSATGLKATVTLASVATDAGYASTYVLKDRDGNQLGSKINIPQDQFLSSATFIASATAEDKGHDSSVVTGDPYVKFVFIMKNTAATTPLTSYTYVPMKSLVDVYTGTNGVKIESYGVSGVVDPASETYLTVSATGFKVTGIDAINTIANNNAAAITALQTATGTLDTSLTAEIAAREAVDGITGQTYTAPTGTNYLGAATSLNNADTLLDKAVKNVSDSVTAITATTLGDYYKKTETSSSTQISGAIKTVTDANAATQAEVTYVSGVVNGMYTNAQIDDKVTAAAAASKTVVTQGRGVTVTSNTAADGHVEYNVAGNIATAAAVGMVKAGASISADTDGTLGIVTGTLKVASAVNADSAATAAKLDHTLSIKQGTGDTATYNGTADTSVELQSTVVTADTASGAAVTVASSTASNVVTYTVGLQITGDDI